MKEGRREERERGRKSYWTNVIGGMSDLLDSVLISKTNTAMNFMRLFLSKCRGHKPKA